MPNPTQKERIDDLALVVFQLTTLIEGAFGPVLDQDEKIKEEFQLMSGLAYNTISSAKRDELVRKIAQQREDRDNASKIHANPSGGQVD